MEREHAGGTGSKERDGRIKALFKTRNVTHLTGREKVGSEPYHQLPHEPGTNPHFWLLFSNTRREQDNLSLEQSPTFPITVMPLTFILISSPGFAFRWYP